MSAIVNEISPIIRKTRDILLPFYGKAEEAARKGENAHSVVTELDMKVEDFLSSRLYEFDPSIGFVGEEMGGERSGKRFWPCDPIDGTLHYLRGIPNCTVMLALIDEHQVVFGAIYDFLQDVLYHAEKDEGAYANGARIHISTRRATDAYFFCETQRRKPKNAEKYWQLDERFQIMNTISAGWEYVQVATGKLEARVNLDPYGKDYDYAAGALLVKEAGGVVANLGKRTYDYRNCDLIVASPNVFAALTEGPDAIFPISE